MDYSVKKYLACMRYSARISSFNEGLWDFMKSYVTIGYTVFVKDQREDYRKRCMEGQKLVCGDDGGIAKIYENYLVLDLTSKIGKNFKKNMPWKKNIP